MYYRKERLRFPSGPLKEIDLEQAIEEITDLPIYDETPETFLIFNKDDQTIHVSKTGEDRWSFGMPNISEEEPRVLEGQGGLLCGYLQAEDLTSLMTHRHNASLSPPGCIQAYLYQTRKTRTIDPGNLPGDPTSCTQTKGKTRSKACSEGKPL